MSRSKDGLERDVLHGGGAFTFLSRLGHRSLAGSLSWLLIAGYVLTTAVYAFTFGHYLSNVLGGGATLARLLAVGIMAALAAVNVRGVGDASAVEIVTVWGKLAVLGLLAGIGIARWESQSLGGLVEAASLTFLVTFAGVNYLAVTDSKGSRWLPAIGAVTAVAAAPVAAWRLAIEQPASLIALATITLAAVAIRPILLHGVEA